MGKTVSKVFFNASVIIAALNSLQGGSAKLINWSQKGKIKGIISPIIYNEVFLHLDKIKIDEVEVRRVLLYSFLLIKEPDRRKVDDFKKIVLDPGDAHVLASADECKADYLVTHDQKHLLVLKNKVKRFKISTPKELIEDLDFKV